MLPWAIWLQSQQRMCQTLHLLRYAFVNRFFFLPLASADKYRNVYWCSVWFLLSNSKDWSQFDIWFLLFSNSFSSLKWLQPTSSTLRSVRILFGWPRMNCWSIFLRKLSSLIRWSSADPTRILFLHKVFAIQLKQEYRLLVEELKLTQKILGCRCQLIFSVCSFLLLVTKARPNAWIYG